MAVIILLLLMSSKLTLKIFWLDDKFYVNQPGAENTRVHNG